jgi:hypothetical protein
VLQCQGMRAPTGGRLAAVLGAVASLLLFLSACGDDAKPTSAKLVTTSSASATHSTATPTAKLQDKQPHHLHHGRSGARTGHTRRQRKTKAHSSRTRRHKAALALHSPQLCPLTGLRPRDGRVPHRAAVAVKVENLPEARPQWGLDKADIVFEEPVEGGITRFIAVYQCQNAGRIEPVRSGRLVDPEILEPMGEVLFGYAGAIQPVVQEVDSRRSLLSDLSFNVASRAYWRDPDRYAPHNLVTSTGALYRAAAALHYPAKPPTAIFSYGRPVKGGTPAAAVSISYPLDTTTWTWHRGTGLWYRSYSDTGPALQGDGHQIAASNVIVMLVHEYQSQYTEDALGAHENLLRLKGAGAAWVFRDGAVFFGKWARPLLDHPTIFIEKKNGFIIRLTPGNTWEELVPAGLKISVEP